MYNLQMYNVQMYNVQMYNVQMYSVQMYNVQNYNVQMFKCTNVQMYKCTNVQIYILAKQADLFYTQGSPLAELSFFGLIPGPPARLPSGAHFPSVLTIFKTAVAFKVFIVGISVFNKTCWKLNSTAV